MEYRDRCIDAYMRELLDTFGAVCVEGPKWCGKTWTAMHHSASKIMIGDPAYNFQNRQMAMLNPALVLNGDYPRLIDEWQEVPPLWDAVRFTVDQKQRNGLFILTGSATPQHKGILHSGTGRIARMKMRTMSLYESGDSDGKVSLKALFDGEQEAAMTDEMSLDRLVMLCLRGGWPKVACGGKSTFLPAKEYIKAVVEDDVYRVSGVQHDTVKMTRLLRSLARNECTTVSNNKLRQDIQEKDNDTVDNDTISRYLELFERLFLTDNIRPFGTHLRSSVRLKQAEKRRFVDPSLPCALLSATKEKLMGDLNTFGFIFESLCERDLLVYAESIGGSVCHYQDYNNKEIDCVVEMPDGRWGAFEIKLGMNQVDEAARNLINIKDSFVVKGDTPPSVLAVVCGMSRAAYQREDGVYVVPITSLKP